MKTPIAITLIVAGTLILITPAVSDYFFQRNLMSLLSRPGVTNATLDGKMEDLYRLGCWFAGCAMIGVAVCGSTFARRRSVEENSGRVSPGASPYSPGPLPHFLPRA